MQSENDKALCELIAPMAAAVQVGQFGPFANPQAAAAHYRTMIDGLGALRERTYYQPAGAYFDDIELRPGLRTGISVPYGPGPFPVILHAHGNGFMAGDIADYKSTLMDFAHGGFVTVLPAYRLAPENPFPAGFDDMMYAASWLAANIGRYGGDPGRVVISGNSTGGGFAYALARTLMSTPLRDSLRAVAGFDGFYDWRARGAAGLIGFYLGGNLELTADPRVSVAVDLKPGMLPPNLYLSTGSADFAAPPTLGFAQLLRSQNIDFELHLLEGNFHDAARFPELDGGREVTRLFLEFAHRACNVRA
ncbi:MAG: alpha/beta hydrolase [Steroidobacteraceae bacterium]|jgi:acetyl esterase